MSKGKLILHSFLATLLAFVLSVVFIGSISSFADGGDAILQGISYALLIGSLTILPPYLLINFLVILIIIKSELPIKKLVMLWSAGAIIMAVLFVRSVVQQTPNEYVFYIFLLIASSMLNVFFILRNKNVTA